MVTLGGGVASCISGTERLCASLLSRFQEERVGSTEKSFPPFYPQLRFLQMGLYYVEIGQCILKAWDVCYMPRVCNQGWRGGGEG